MKNRILGTARCGFLAAAVLGAVLTGLDAGAQTARTLRPVAALTGELKGTTLYGNSHALIIGVNEYPKLPLNRQLKCAENDAKALREVLIARYGFADQNVTLLLGPAATKRGIDDALIDLSSPSRVSRDDRVIVFFSGHGNAVAASNGTKMGFLVPYDAEVDLAQPDAAHYFRTCVSMRSVWERLEATPAKHVLLIADACFSGLLVRGRDPSERDLSLSATAIREWVSRPAMQVLTASGREQESKEDPARGHGFFTLKLLEELRAKAANADLAFPVAVLAAQLQVSVPKLSPGQLPQFDNYGGTEGQFVFVPTEAAAVPEFRVAQGHPDPVVRPAPQSPPGQVQPPGTLTVEDTGFSDEVFVDERSLGQSPVTVRDLAPGAHVIRIVSLGREVYRATVTIHSGAVERLRARVEGRSDPHDPLRLQATVPAETQDQLSGSLFVEDTGVPDEVFVDGRAVGPSPVTIPNLRVGARRIRIVSEGHEAFQATVTIRPAAVERLRARLERKLVTQSPPPSQATLPKRDRGSGQTSPMERVVRKILAAADGDFASLKARFRPDLSSPTLATWECSETMEGIWEASFVRSFQGKTFVEGWVNHGPLESMVPLFDITASAVSSLAKELGWRQGQMNAEQRRNLNAHAGVVVEVEPDRGFMVALMRVGERYVLRWILHKVE